MFSDGGNEADAIRVSLRSAPAPGHSSRPGLSSLSAADSSAFVSDSLPASVRSSRLALSLLLAEAAAFALAAASGKIPAFLFTAVRALLTF